MIIKSGSMRVHADFKKTVIEFIKIFTEKNNLKKLSTEEATKIINQKIQDAGGLVI